jgi:hypothetical protein
MDALLDDITLWQLCGARAQVVAAPAAGRAQPALDGR